MEDVTIIVAALEDCTMLEGMEELEVTPAPEGVMTEGGSPLLEPVAEAMQEKIAD